LQQRIEREKVIAPGAFVPVAIGRDCFAGLEFEPTRAIDGEGDELLVVDQQAGGEQRGIVPALPVTLAGVVAADDGGGV